MVPQKLKKSKMLDIASVSEGQMSDRVKKVEFSAPKQSLVIEERPF